MLPQADASGYLRYERTAYLQTGGSPINVPANGSCQVLIGGTHTNLTARFTLNAPAQVSVTPLGDQIYYAHSYIGEGGTGALGPLVDQMTRRFPTRHDSFALAVPAGADYMFVKYGPTAFDPYAADQYSYGLAGSGTYRFELGNGGLAVDMVNSMGIPTGGNWRDADQMGGAAFLSYSSLNGRIKTPEYFLPPGIHFQPCMTSGGCEGALLDQIYNQTFPVQVYFYKVERLAGSQLTRVPLKMVGKGWAAADMSAAELAAAPFRYAAAPPAAAATLVDPAQALPLRVFLPVIGKAETLPPGDPAGCPCGWFDAQGAMFDFIPPQ